MKPAPARSPTGHEITGSTAAATAPTPAPISTGLVDGCAAPSLAISLISFAASESRSPPRGSLASGIALSPWIDWKRLAQFRNPAANAFLDLRVARVAVLADALEHFGDQAADLAELGRAESARGARRGAEADARGLRRRQRIERDRVLVAGQERAVEANFGRFAGHFLGPEVDQHQVVVGSARDDPQAMLLEARGERLGVLDHRAGIDLELGPQRFAEGDGLGRDQVHRGAALQAR